MTSHFIVFEGPDGSGTTRQSEFLARRMKSEGFDVLLTAEPTNGKIGKEIRSLLDTHSMPSPEAIQLLFCADRAEHVATEIIPALEAGKTVICDRYIPSTIIYGATQGLDREWLEAVNKNFPQPDVMFVTLPPMDVCFERVFRRKTQDQFEKKEFMEKIYKEYEALDGPNTVFVDTSKSKQENADCVWDEVQKKFQPISRDNISKMEL